jgi:CheY-like chemotaxis protein/anti-sigma regulatory factor (Ser/Thr protein kinase)
MGERFGHVTVRVLLVDDVADVRRLVRVALRFHGGFDVVGEAQAGVEAIELATELRPDVVLLDLGLPDLAGREVLTRLREVAPSAKVVVFTGRDEEDRPFFEKHAAGFVTKSGELDHLLALLDDLTRSADHEAAAEFAAEVSCVPQAREFVRRQLEEWGAGPFDDEASLVVTELAANAVLHAGSPFRVRVSMSSGLLRIEVSDDDGGTPEPQPFSATAEHGRGIVLVSALSSSWGIDTVPGHGKVTWAELAPA